jgi:hypothetical protein
MRGARRDVRALPAPLPEGETILWQGAPVWRSLYRVAFHVRGLALYFAAMLLLRAAFEWAEGHGVAGAAVAAAWLLPLAAACLALLALIAWLSARATWYTITNRRVIMRIGIVLEVTFNFPFKVIESAGLRLHRDGTGDIALRFVDGEQIAYAHLWPHARPWHFKRTEPMLRCVADGTGVATLLARAIATHTGGSALPVASVAADPARDHAATGALGAAG